MQTEKTMVQDGFLYHKSTMTIMANLETDSVISYDDEISDYEIFEGTKKQAEEFGLIFNQQTLY